MRIQSNAEYARERAARDVSDAAVWRREAEVWFDGTVQSVDSRLAMCRRLLHGSRTEAATQGASEQRLAAIAEYEQSQAALEHLRRQLLTGCVDIEAGHYGDHDPQYDYNPDDPDGLWEHPDGSFHEQAPRFGPHGYEPPTHHASLQPSDRRWVTLEAARFIRDHSDVDLHEAQIRATNHADSCTGILPAKRARAITAAFVDEVTRLHRQRPRKIASAPPAPPECPPEMIFV